MAVIAEAEFATSVSKLRTVAITLGTIAERYEACMEALAENGFKSASMSTPLEEKGSLVSTEVQGAAQVIEQVEASLQEFLKDLDDIDQDIY